MSILFVILSVIEVLVYIIYEGFDLTRLDLRETTKLIFGMRFEYE